MSILHREIVTLGHRQRGLRAQVWRGGSGTPLVLLHGGWAGARAHWAPVWEQLAGRYTVIAPELPGIAPGSGDALGTYAEYADWVAELLDTLQCAPAAVAGNSMGATIAWMLALRHAPRCKALLMVDGFPPPALPGWLRWALLNTPLQRMALAQMRREVFGPRALETGFHDPQRAPQEVRDAIAAPSPHSGTPGAMLRMTLRSEAPAARAAQPVLVVWGASDRLPRCEPPRGRALHEGLPGSRFAVIDEAGHLPQVEQPGRFLAAVLPFLADTAT